MEREILSVKAKQSKRKVGYRWNIISQLKYLCGGHFLDYSLQLQKVEMTFSLWYTISEIEYVLPNE